MNKYVTICNYSKYVEKLTTLEEGILMKLIRSGILEKDTNHIKKDNLEGKFKSLKLSSGEEIRTAFELFNRYWIKNVGGQDTLFEVNDLGGNETENQNNDVNIKNNIINNNNTNKIINNNKFNNIKNNLFNNPSCIGFKINARTNNEDFEEIGETLTSRQIKYLTVAIKNTIAKAKIKVSNPKELWNQFIFSIINPNQHRGIMGFRRVVGRFMRIFADGNWRKPFGFDKYSDFGKSNKIKEKQQEEAWEAQKQEPVKADFLPNLAKMHKDQDIMIQKALSCAAELKIRMEEKKQMTGSVEGLFRLFDDFTRKIQGFLSQGGNKSEVINYLKENVIVLLPQNSSQNEQNIS